MLKLSLLGDAVADTEDPTPGYMYKEICNISQESGAYCSDLLEYLVSQLSSRSYNVKYKVLKIMRYVVQDGSPDFREGLRKQSLGITDAIQFSGPPHPSRGMEPYIKVRKEAAALCELLFTETEVKNEKAQDRPSHLQLGGMGSSTPGLMGFGNTTRASKSGFVTSVKDFAEKVLSPPKPASYLDEASDKKFGDYQPASFVEHMSEPGTESSVSLGGSRSQVDSSSPVKYLTQKTTRRKPVGRKKGVAGGGWADLDEELVEDSSSHASAELGSNIHDKSDLIEEQGLIDTEDLAERLQQVQASEASTEMKLVDDFTMEPDTFIISHEDIKDFTRKCSMLNCDIILQKLALKLTVEEEYIQMRAMLLLEGLLRTDHVTADQVVSACSGELLTLFNTSAKDRRRAKARKILRILEKLSTTNKLIKEDNSSNAGITVRRDEVIMQY